MRIVFFGTDYFGVPAVCLLKQGGHEICGIVTTGPRAKGRGLKLTESSVALYAAQAGIQPVFTPEKLKDADFIKELASLNADLFLVAAYRILPPEVFMMPRLGTINIHGSLLPKYRGPAPIQRALEAGEKKTGITIFAIDQGIDSGRIIIQRSIDIGFADTSPQIYERLAHIGAEAAYEAVRRMDNGSVEFVRQDDSLASRAPKLIREEALIDWSNSATLIYNRIRAFKPFPGTYTLFNGRRLEIEWGEPRDGASDYSPGTVCEVTENFFCVQCSPGVLQVLEVKPEGKKKMNVAAYMRGTRISCGMEMGCPLEK